jgi:hypothetical protein
VNDPDIDLSRIASGIERIADAVNPRPTLSPTLETDVEVVSSETEVKIIQGESEKCVTYTIASSDLNGKKHISMSIRFLLKEDPKWRAGQRIKVTIT